MTGRVIAPGLPRARPRRQAQARRPKGTGQPWIIQLSVIGAGSKSARRALKPLHQVVRSFHDTVTLGPFPAEGESEVEECPNITAMD
jgi:hypothetical protein